MKKELKPAVLFLGALVTASGLAAALFPDLAELGLDRLARRTVRKDGVLLAMLGACGILYAVKGLQIKPGRVRGACAAVSLAVFAASLTAELALTLQRRGALGGAGGLTITAVQFASLGAVALTIYGRKHQRRRTAEKSRNGGTARTGGK